MGVEYLKKFIKHHPAWNDIQFWEEYFWNEVSKAFKGRFKSYIVVQAKDGLSSKEMAFVSAFTAEFMAELFKWGIEHKDISKLLNIVLKRIIVSKDKIEQARTKIEQMMSEITSGQTRIATHKKGSKITKKNKAILQERLSLEKVMEMQKKTLPNLKLPWILPYLTSEIELLILKNPSQSFGLFKTSVDKSKLSAIEKKIAKGKTKLKTENPHLPANLLKAWFFKLPTPLFSSDIVKESILAKAIKGGLGDCMRLVNKLNSINTKVVTHLVDFIYGLKPQYNNTNMTPKEYAIQFSTCLFYVKGSAIKTMNDVKPSQNQIEFLEMIFSKGESK